jgi:hypothetical protein
LIACRYALFGNIAKYGVKLLFNLVIVKVFKK